MLNQAQRRLIVALAGIVIVLAYASRESWERSHQYQSQNSSYKTKPESKKIDTDELIADYTLALAIATGVLAASTFLLWWQTRKSSLIAERALTELEAPFVFVKINEPGLKIQDGAVSFGWLKWCVVNYGRTPASLLEVFQDVQSIERDHSPLPINPAEQQGHELPYGVIAPPNGGQSHDFPAIAIGPFLQNPGAPGQPFSTHSAFFLGFVRYSDIFRNRFILGFCFLFDIGSRTWIRILGDEYNYCRKES
jgi:hypothetical protein